LDTTETHTTTEKYSFAASEVTITAQTQK